MKVKRQEQPLLFLAVVAFIVLFVIVVVAVQQGTGGSQSKAAPVMGTSDDMLSLEKDLPLLEDDTVDQDFQALDSLE